MSERWIDWPGPRASGFAGRATHYRVTRPLTHGGALETAACGGGSDLTTDPRRVTCLRCYRTRAYRKAATALLD